MLTFIIPLRARVLARNWSHHTWLLERTLESVLAQTSSEFDVVVVCHDMPDIPQAKHPAVHLISVDYPPPQRNNDDMCRDKVLKISRGVEWAIDRGSDYVMYVDADDLVSRRLGEFVANHSADNGWYLHTGYVHRYGERWMREHAPHHLICGTGVIVRSNLLRFAKSDFCRGEDANTLAAAGHENYVAHLAAQGAVIQPLPFPGAVYVLHGDSTSEAPGGAGYRLGGSGAPRPPWRRVLSWGKQTAKRLPKMRPVSAALRMEFSVPKADAVQHG